LRESGIATLFSILPNQKLFSFVVICGGTNIVIMTLDTIRTSELGDSAIKRIMREIYQVYVRKNNLNAADFAKAVEAVMSGTDWPQDRSDEIHRRLENITQHSNNPENRKINDWGNWFSLTSTKPQESGIATLFSILSNQKLFTFVVIYGKQI
jgi:hypothetical protein